MTKQEVNHEVDPLAQQDLLAGAQVKLSSRLPKIDGEHVADW
jgi:hypothetical protein